MPGEHPGPFHALSLLLLLILAPSGEVVGQANPGRDSTWLHHDSLVADLGELADFVEQTHPDPYGVDGKLGFHRRLHRTLRSIPESGMSREAFHGLLEPFLAQIGDGHTKLQSLVTTQDPENDGPGLPIDFQILAENAQRPVPKLFVRGVTGFGDELVGAEVLAVAGVNLSVLLERERQRESYENDFGNLQNLVWRLGREQGLRNLIPEWSVGDSISVELRLPGGERRGLLLRRGTAPKTWDEAFAGVRTSVSLPLTRVGEPVYRFLDPERTKALLRLDNTWAYRETFEVLVKRGRGNLNWARSFYRTYHGTTPPADTTRLVEALPAATDVLRSLVEEMRIADTQTLIVDLRRNSGGTSAIVNMLLYYLYGREGWRQFFGHFYTIRRVTSNELEERDSATVSRFPFRAGDYDFSGEFRAAERTPSEAGDESYWKATTISFGEELERNTYEGYYAPPHVIALVSPGTFSGGFWVAAALRRMGARLVGVSSGQAGNAFANVRYTTLSRSHLRVGVSSRLFVLFPEERAGMNVLPVDLALTFDRWRATGFAPNAELLMALDSVAAAGEVRE